MSRNVNEVFQEAARLPERDRATLAGLLIETLDPVSDSEVEAAWSEEIKRRLTEIDAGTVELISWEEVREELCECLRKTTFHSINSTNTTLLHATPREQPKSPHD